MDATGWSWPPSTTGNSWGRPVSPAVFALTLPTILPLGSTSGKREGSNPKGASISSDQVDRSRSNAKVRQAIEGSVTKRLHNR